MRTRITLRVAAPIIALLAGACTQPWTCPTDDWQRAGYYDGLQGRDRTRLDDYVPVCARVGATPDREAWTRGYERGIAHYCTERNAYRMGFRSHEWFNVLACPAEDRPGLEDAYHQGYVYREMIEDLRDRRLFWPYYPVFPYYP